MALVSSLFKALGENYTFHVRESLQITASDQVFNYPFLFLHFAELFFYIGKNFLEIFLTEIWGAWIPVPVIEKKNMIESLLKCNVIHFL